MLYILTAIVEIYEFDTNIVKSHLNLKKREHIKACEIFDIFF